MKIQIITIGKKHDPEIAMAIQEFSTRISRYTDVEWKIMPPLKTVEEESQAILKAVGDRDYMVVLDEKGKQLTSMEFAKFFENRINESEHRIVFVIGGAYGVSQELKAEANAILSLSHLTFPHQIARLVLIEQIYRALSILKGEKYHHE